MKSLVLACSTAAVTLTAVPVAAQHHATPAVCNEWRHGRCISWHPVAGHEARIGRYKIGDNLGPHYPYVEAGALPQAVVTRYHLGSKFRYVNENGRVYVVNPHSYRVVRVITVP